MDKKTSTKNLIIGQNEKAVMVQEPGEDFPVKPQQLIGGINGLILQLHKMNARVEESKQNHKEQAEKIERVEKRNENLKDEIEDLRKVKERLSEQNDFLEKSLNKKKEENNELHERLKEAEIQLGESGGVLDTVRNLESKNELLNIKMSNIVLNTEEEFAKVITERDHYLGLLDEVTQLNQRNITIQQTVEEYQQVSQQDQKNLKKLIMNAEEATNEIAKELEEIRLAKKEYLKLIEQQKGFETDARKNSVALEQENQELKKKMKDFSTRYGGLGRNMKDLRKNNDSLKEELEKTKQEKEEIQKEVNSLKEQLRTASRLAQEHTALLDKTERSKRYEELEKQMQTLIESCGNTTEQLASLKGSVDESKDLLKANIDGVVLHNTELNETGGNSCEKVPSDSSFDQECFEVVVEMQDLLKHLQIRDEELANLEKLAGLPEKREREGGCGIVSSIRGLITMKETMISGLEEERDELADEVREIKKNSYKQAYLMDELQKEKDDVLAKLAACQEKYSQIKEEKEELRKDILVRNTTDKMTDTYINKLKQENEQYKTTFHKHQETFKQKYSTMKNEYDKKLETRDVFIRDVKSKLSVCQQEKEKIKTQLDSLLQKDSAIKEKIISIFTK